jgi:hypothetical protein
MASEANALSAELRGRDVSLPGHVLVARSDDDAFAEVCCDG